MKSTFMKFVGAALIVMSLTGFVVGASLPYGADIINRDNFQDYVGRTAKMGEVAATLVCRYQHWVSGNIDYSDRGAVTFISGSCSNMFDAMTKISSTNLAYGLQFSNGWVGEYISLNDQYGNVIYWGSIGYYGIGGGDKLPLILEPYNIPVLRAVTWVDVFASDNNGNYTNYTPQINNGQIIFPASYTGARNASMDVLFEDQQWRHYNLADPVQPPIVSPLAGKIHADDFGQIVMKDKKPVLTMTATYRDPIGYGFMPKKGMLTVDVLAFTLDPATGYPIRERPLTITATPLFGFGPEQTFDLGGDGSDDGVQKAGPFGAGWWVFRLGWKDFQQNIQNQLYVPVNTAPVAGAVKG